MSRSTLRTSTSTQLLHGAAPIILSQRRLTRTYNGQLSHSCVENYWSNPRIREDVAETNKKD